MTTAEILQMLIDRRAVEDAAEIVDRLLDIPEAVQALFDQFLVRAATGRVLGDVRYQPAVSSLVTTYRMIGRMTEGRFILPVD